MASVDLITVSQAKDFLNIDSDDATFDSILQTLVTQASKLFQTELGRDLNKQTYTEFYSHTGRSNQLFLRNYPLDSVSKIWEDRGRDFDSGAELDTSDDIFTHDEEGIIYKDGGDWSKGQRHIKVTYDAGYSSIPSDIERAIQYWVARMFKEEREDWFERTSINLPGGQSFNVDNTKPPSFVQRVIKLYDKDRL